MYVQVEIKTGLQRVKDKGVVIGHRAHTHLDEHHAPLIHRAQLMKVIAGGV